MTTSPTENSPPTDWSLACEHLCVQRGRTLAIDDVSLTLQPGERLSLIGPNGSGKTSLLLALLGLLKPQRGHVQLNSCDMSRIPADERARFAAYVPQALAATPAFSVREVIAGGRFAHRSNSPHTDADIVDDALARCGLTQLADRSFDKLSGGERQKTLIAAAFAQTPTVLFLDEPNAALDPAYQIQLVQILRTWCDDGGTLVLVSHDLQLPAALGGRVVALRAGRIAADGPASETLAPDMLSRIYDADFAVARTSRGEAVVLPAWWSS